jgi:uncharacterized protein DUF6572
MGYGIEFPDSIDLITADADGNIRLIVSSPDAWTGSTHERDLLERKLQSYLLFVENGQFERSYPDVDRSRIRFQIDTITPLPTSLSKWVQDIGDVLRNDHGIELGVVDV